MQIIYYELTNCSHCLALTICTKSGLSDAPPTRNPSTSGFKAKDLQFPAVTDPAKVRIVVMMQAIL